MQYGVFKKGDSVVCPVDSSGRFTKEVTDFAGQHVKVRGRGGAGGGAVVGMWQYLKVRVGDRV